MDHIWPCSNTEHSRIIKGVPGAVRHQHHSHVVLTIVAYHATDPVLGGQAWLKIAIYMTQVQPLQSHHKLAGRCDLDNLVLVNIVCSGKPNIGSCNCKMHCILCRPRQQDASVLDCTYLFQPFHGTSDIFLWLIGTRPCQLHSKDFGGRIQQGVLDTVQLPATPYTIAGCESAYKCLGRHHI